MTSRFKWITSQSLLYRFKAEIEKGETNISKLSRLKTMLYDEFTMCRKQGKLLRDFDLRVMAMNISKKLEIDFESKENSELSAEKSQLL
jgi:CRISPR/Cas system CMR subunit Cmr4 (Cas7 group RAMP superfamily)